MYAGVDPGGKGAIAYYYPPSNGAGHRFEIEKLSCEALALLRARHRDKQIQKIVIEKLKPLPHDTPKTAWELGKTVGWIEMFVYDTPFANTSYLTPEEWQKWAHKGISHSDPPNLRTINAFEKKFPAIKMPHYAKAAAMMAVYASLID